MAEDGTKMTFLSDFEMAYNRLVNEVDVLKKYIRELQEEKELLKKKLLEISNKDSKK
jgi:hypothetical protein